MTTQTASNSTPAAAPLRADIRADWRAVALSPGVSDGSILNEMISRPYLFDFFEAVRRVESLTPSLPRIGWATRADQELIRIGQSVHLDFAPATIDDVTRTPSGRIRLQQRFFGLWGPGGALPLPMTESARDQWRHEGDRTLIAFADIFHHRMATLFYRVWSTSRGAIQRDRPDEDRFAEFVGAIAGIGRPRTPRTRHHTTSSPSNKAPGAVAESLSSAAVRDWQRYHAARFGIRRNAEGLKDLLSGALGIAVEVCTFVGTTLPLRREDQACLRRSCPRENHRAPLAGTLGGGLVLGRRIEDHASTIEVKLGPLDLKTYRSMMPGGAGHLTLARLIRSYAGRGLQVRVRLILQRCELPPLRLGISASLGRDAWLSSDVPDRHAENYHFTL